MSELLSAIDIGDLMRLGPVIPVLTIERTDDAAPLARALAAGGLRVLEVTLRTPAALDAIARIKWEVPEVIVGAGTVLTAADFEQAVEAGSRFVVTPGLTENIAKAAAGSEVPILPGIATATELMRGLDFGLSHFKFFPAQSSGGVAALKALYGPFAACRFCPTGGITLESAPSYLALPNVLCVGGGWVAPADAIAEGDWARITALALEASVLAMPSVRSDI